MRASEGESSKIPRSSTALRLRGHPSWSGHSDVPAASPPSANRKSVCNALDRSLASTRAESAHKGFPSDTASARSDVGWSSPELSRWSSGLRTVSTPLRRSAHNPAAWARSRLTRRTGLRLCRITSPGHKGRDTCFTQLRHPLDQRRIGRHVKRMPGVPILSDAQRVKSRQQR